ncbi:MAG: hypothetical protein EB117_14485 [Betaproteobacteria bacterium]|nr:hypothetical protein [Betaproteobacteria bacterium]
MISLDLHKSMTDGLALSAGSMFALAASEADNLLKVIVGLLTCVFLGLGIYLRIQEIKDTKRKPTRRKNNG